MKDDMNIIYVANVRIRSRKAHPYQIIQMCNAFVELGHDLELIVPTRNLPDDVSPPVDMYYDTDIDYKITYLPCIDFLKYNSKLPNIFKSPIYYIQSVTFSLSALIYVLSLEYDVLYTRAQIFTLISSLHIKGIVLELHRVPGNTLARWLLGKALDNCKKIVVISQGLYDETRSMSDTEIIIAPDGVRLEKFNIGKSQQELRGELNLLFDKPIACYAGSLYPRKGVGVLIQAAKFLENVEIVIVGGSADEISHIKNKYDEGFNNVHFIGHVLPKRVPRYLLASDVLVVPNSSKYDISAFYTSPLKVFEYMAAGRTIVASDIPSLREVLDEEIAIFAPPDDPEGLAEAIKEAAQSNQCKGKLARERATKYSWRSRADYILSGI